MKTRILLALGAAFAAAVAALTWMIHGGGAVL